MEIINFEDFQKIDLRVAEIIEAEAIDGSDKLVRLKIKLADQERQIIAGIKMHYQSSDLIGRQIIVVANLAPRTMMGYQSQGMLLAANDGKLSLLQPDKEVEPGTKIN
jgi:methionine--tRNA ligase beta chain